MSTEALGPVPAATPRGRGTASPGPRPSAPGRGMPGRHSRPVLVVRPASLPGPALVAELAEQAVDGLGVDELLDRVEQLMACRSWLDAMTLRTTAALARVYPGDPEHVVDELRAALRFGPVQANSHYHLACRLAELPVLAQALADGTVSSAHAQAIVNALDEVPYPASDPAGTTEETAAGAAHRSPVPEELITRFVAYAQQRPASATAAFTARKLAPYREPAPGPVPGPPRRLQMYPNNCGVEVHAELDVHSAALLDAALSRYTVRRADLAPGDTLAPLETRRADALIELARVGLDPASVAVGRPPRAPVTVTVVTAHPDVTGRPGPQTVQRADTHGSEPADPVDEPAGELAHYGLLNRHGLARAVCDSTGTRVVHVDPRGRLLYQEHRTDRANHALRAHLAARDQHCQFPHCRIPAARCQVHHARTFAAQGSTDPINCVLVCNHHHHSVHDGGWRTRRSADLPNTTVWTSPVGRVYHVHPPSYPLLDSDAGPEPEP